MKYLIFFSLFLSVSAFAKPEKGVRIEKVKTPEGEQEVRYEYLKHQKIDAEELQIDAETGGPADLSIITRHQEEFKNRLPYRKNFNAEIRKSVERIR